MPREEDVRRIVAGGRERNLSDDQIRALVARYDERQQVQPSPIQDSSSFVDTAIDALPNIGGLAGSFVGSAPSKALRAIGIPVPNPLGVTGATLGGMAGEGFRQTANALRGRWEDVPATISGRLKQIGSAGAVQGAAEAAGRGIVGPMAKGAYAVAMRPVKALRDKYGLKTLINEGFEKRIMPTKGGSAKAGKAVEESKAAQRGMAQDYDARPTQRLDVKEPARRGLRPLQTQIERADVATGSGLGDITKLRRQFGRVQQANPSGMSAAEMLDAKHAADAIADPAYVASRRLGAPVDPASKAGIAKGWSKGYRETLNEAVGPEFAQQGQKTKALFGVGRMADFAAERPEQLANYFSIGSGAVGTAGSGGDVGTGVKSMLATRALMSPRLQAGAALAASPLARYGTRAADALTGSNAEQMMRQALLALMQRQGSDR